MTPPVCDVCEDPDAPYRFTAMGFTARRLGAAKLPPPPGVGMGWWVCLSCCVCIGTDDWSELVERAMRAPSAAEWEPDFARWYYEELFAWFNACRLGGWNLHSRKAPT